MIVEATFVGLLIAAFWRSSNKKGMTEERKKVYLSAMENLTDPEKLREFAAEFDKGGCQIEANLLRKRAALREMPKEKKEEYRAIYERAMTSDVDSKGNPVDPRVIDKLALAFESLTASGSARNLRKRAKELREKYATQEKEKRAIAQKMRDKETKDAAEKARNGQATEVKPEKKSEVIEVKAEVVSDSPAIHGEDK